MAAESSAGPTRPDVPQVTMGLLEYLTATSMDGDYAHVAERHAREAGRASSGGAASPTKSSGGLAALVVLGLFGLLVATAALQTSRNAAEEADGRDQLITQIQARSAQVDALRGRAESLREEVDQVQTDYLEATTRGRQLSTRLSRLSVTTGAAAVTGPGVKVVVDDNPSATSDSETVLDKDLQKLVNALWLSGAEAISVDGQRLNSLGAIRQAGTAITVNGRSISPPYTILAIGNRNAMPARFVETRGGATWLDYQSTYGLEFTMTSEESLRLPAANQLTLRHAHVPDTRR
ncbi:MAG TPA: DUF881 domain-containing protein [Nocardioidaceae bacterium]|nr:DUF881 domain-containing protein [Nocardioidaceae bacterium]